MASSPAKALTSPASRSGAGALPMGGPLAPECDVEKRAGSMNSKSFSSIMRCISTEPTMPRHPTNPTRIISLLLLSFHGRQHERRMHARHRVHVDILAGAERVRATRALDGEAELPVQSQRRKIVGVDPQFQALVVEPAVGEPYRGLHQR